MASKVGQYIMLKGLISEEYLTVQGRRPRRVIEYGVTNPFQVKYWHFGGLWVCNLTS